jgi:hypothetical protein
MHAEYVLGSDHGPLQSRFDQKVKPDETVMKRLMAAAMKTGREGGDLYPRLLTRQCCEFYDSLTLVWCLLLNSGAFLSDSECC